MRNVVDFGPYRRSTIGFDRLFDLIENGAASSAAEGFPPFDLERTGEDEYRISLAVAGFSPEEIEVVAQQNVLIVSGRKRDDGHGEYIHRGIATRAFERRFGLADFVKVKGAELRDGMLSIELAREIPEEMKPRRIPIGGSAGRIGDGSQQQAPAEKDVENDNEKGREAA